MFPPLWIGTTATAPSIILVSPPEGTLTQWDPVVIDTTDPDFDISSFVPVFNQVVAWAPDGSGPGDAFLSSTRVALPGYGNYRYTFRPNTGFKNGPLTFTGMAFDRAGHGTRVTFQWTVQSGLPPTPPASTENEVIDKADIALQWGGGFADTYIADDDLALDEGLRTAVILSLYTERRAEPDDDIPSGDGDRRGWWADEFAPVAADRMGSRLWLLDRSAQRSDLARRAEEYIREGLAWML